MGQASAPMEGAGPSCAGKGPTGRRRVLVTGAAGRIGSCFAEHARARYDLRLVVRGDEPGREKLAPWGEVVAADLGDLGALKEVCRGMDTVVHLAASPDPSAVWGDLLANNIVGTYHLMAAAKSAGCRRVVYASSIHAVSGYPSDVQVKAADPVNPGDLYGVSKCFGEALGRYMAEGEGLSVIALRIGAYGPIEKVRQESGVAFLDAFISDRDLNQLLCRCIDDESLKWALFHALSDNRFKRLDISAARTCLGYAPQDDAAKELPRVAPLRLGQSILTHSLADPGQRSGLREDGLKDLTTDSTDRTDKK